MVALRAIASLGAFDWWFTADEVSVFLTLPSILSLFWKLGFEMCHQPGSDSFAS